MSPFVITCPNPVCGKPLNLPAAVGQPLSCPYCSAGISVTLGPDGKPTTPTVIRYGQVPKAFRVMWFVLLSAFVAMPFTCCGISFWWLLQPAGRSDIGEYDIGHGRRVSIWADDRVWGDPVGVYYQITQNGTELCPTTHIGVVHGNPFEFRTAFADDGKVACVYEVNRAADDSEYLILYDAERRETWPRHGKEPGRWRELYWKLREANPDFPRVRHFE